MATPARTAWWCGELTSPWGFDPRRAADRRAGPLAAVGDVAGAQSCDRGLAVEAEASLSGELRHIRAQLTGSAGRLPVHSELTIAPFDPDPLPAIAVRVEGLDINTLLAGAPSTAINAEFKGAAHGSNSVSGTLTAVNTSAGTLDENRLPVRTLTSHATLTRAAIVLEQAATLAGAAGAAGGSARIDASGIAVDLATSRLDLQGLHAALRATQLAGTVRLQVASGRQLINADLRQDNLRVRADAAIEDDRLTLKQFTALAPGASLRGSGELHLAGEFAFSARIVLQDFDPARSAASPQPASTATSPRRRTSPDWRASASYRLRPSSLRGQALGGQGRLTLSARSVQDVDAQLVVGGNRLALHGSFGRAGDSLDFRLDAPRLAAVHADLAGSLRAEGKLGGTPARPELDATLDGHELGYGSYRVQRWIAAARIVQADDPSLHLDSRLERPARGTTTLDASPSPWRARYRVMP